MLRSLSVHAFFCVVAPDVSAPKDVPEPPPPGDLDVLAVDLRWDAPEGCPARDDVVADLQRLTDRTVDPSPGALIIDAAIVRDGGGYTLRVERSQGSLPPDTRSLHDEDCELLAKAAALVVAVDLAPMETAQRTSMRLPSTQLQPRTSLEVREPSAPRPARRDAVPKPPIRSSAEAPRTDATAAARTRWAHRFLAGARGGLALGIVPGPSSSVGGMLGWGFGPLRLEVVGQHTLRRTDEVIDGASIRASSSGGGVHVLYAPSLGPVVVMLGAGFEAGVLAGRGRGDAVRPRPVRAAWTAALVLVGLAWPAEGRIALFAGAQALVPTLRPGLHLDAGARGDVPAFRVPPAGLRVMIGPEIRLP